jgi:two-component system sensor histidine kinase VicK
MEFIGIYLINNLEQYYLDNFSEMLNSQASLLGWSVRSHLEGDQSQLEAIEDLVRGMGSLNSDIREIYVLNPEGVIIASSVYTGLDFVGARQPGIGERVLRSEVISAMAGTIGEGEERIQDQRYKHYAYPIVSSGSIVGIIFIRASLEGTYNILGNIKGILSRATIFAILFTVVLGFALAKTITTPIQRVTSKAADMAKGDFEGEISVKSSDEIGKLTEMFNYLTHRLRETLGEISHEKSKMEAIITYMADGILAINTSGEIIHANPAAGNMLGFLPEKALGKHYRESAEDFFEIPLDQILSSGEQIERDLEMKEQNLTMRCHFAPFKSKKGEISGVVVVIQDITKQEKLEKMRKEFVANVSHELRTPLTTIKSYVETLLDGAIDDRNTAENFLQVVYSESGRMTRLVADLLQLSKIDYQQTQWHKREILLDNLLKDINKKMLVSAKQKGQSLELNINSIGCKVLCDKDRIEQVIINVMSNAIKYTPEGGTISTSLIPEKDGYLITVKDNGIGIPDKDIPRIFERFYRVDKARSRELGGTGLGLSIAKQIIEAHGGKIWIDSKPEQGTTVFMKLLSM